MKIQAVEEIQAPREKVFEIAADIPNAAVNISSIKKIEILGQAQVGEGFRWRETRVIFNKEATEEMWFTSFKAPEQYVIEAKNHGTRYRTEFIFSELNPQSTQVTVNFSGKPLSIFAKLFSPLSLLFAGTMRKCLIDDLMDIKRIAEKGA